jgi:hypothetical protein
MGNYGKMRTHSQENTEIIKTGFLHYQEANPEILATIRMSINEWDALELYKKVSINEFYEIIS